MAEEKLCKDCAFFVRSGNTHQCYAPENGRALSLVTGWSRNNVSCWKNRDREDRCGKAGRWFVKRMSKWRMLLPW